MGAKLLWLPLLPEIFSTHHVSSHNPHQQQWQHERTSWIWWNIISDNCHLSYLLWVGSLSSGHVHYPLGVDICSVHVDVEPSPPFWTVATLVMQLTPFKIADNVPYIVQWFDIPVWGMLKLLSTIISLVWPTVTRI